MIIKSEILKKYSNIILQAVDSNEVSLLTETLELKTEGNKLFMNVTNKEYFAQVKFDSGVSEDFHATVSANLFLKLVAQITTADIELTISNNSLIIKGNGTYKIPLIYDNDHLLELPEIKILNPTVSLDTTGEVLNSILQYNSKELNKGTISRPVQRLYYIDELGAITFTSGACVNNFALSAPIRVLLNDKIVKLFKLFQDKTVHVTLGYDALSDSIIQTKIRFETDDIVLTAIISCDDALINSVPVNAIRGRVTANYPYVINISKDALLQTVNRLLLFSSGAGSKEILKPYSVFDFDINSVTIYDANKENSEILDYFNTSISQKYEAIFDLIDLKATLETCSEKYLTISFGDGQAAVISRGSVFNVIPEVKVI